MKRAASLPGANHQLRLADPGELVGLKIERSWEELQVAWRAAQVAGTVVERADVNLKEENYRHVSEQVTLSDLLEAQVLHCQARDNRSDVIRPTRLLPEAPAHPADRWQ